MDPIERAIRNAFEKGDPDDPAFREKVYRSAAGALERALKANPSTTVERAIARRRVLGETIAAVEAEFLRSRPALAEADLSNLDFAAGEERGQASKRAGAAPAVAADDARSALGKAGPGRREGRVEPSLGDEAFGDPWPEAGGERGRGVPADPDRRPRRGVARRLAGAAVLVLVLALLGAGGWWLVGSGLPPSSSLTADGQEVATGEEESVAGPLSENRETREWINIFNPQDPSTVAIPPGAEASVQTSEGLKLLRVRSGRSGEPIRFTVGQGVLEQLAGRKAVFDIVARAENADGGSFSVACDFGSFGECGRRRYAATAATRADFLFEVELPAGPPGADGAILLDPDVSGSGEALDIFEVRAAPSE